MLRWLLITAIYLLFPAMAAAQDTPRHYSQCQAIAQNLPGASFARYDVTDDAPNLLMSAAASDQTVRLHSSAIPRS
jgi:hypothetical protein